MGIVSSASAADSLTADKGLRARLTADISPVSRHLQLTRILCLQKHVSVTTGVLLCSLMFSGTLCRSSPEDQKAWPGAGHGFTTSLPSDSCLLIPTDSCLSIPVDSSSRLTR